MALTAAERGHQVTLWERRGRIGGLVRSAAMLPFKSTLPRLLRYYETALARANVSLRAVGVPVAMTSPKKSTSQHAECHVD